MKALMCILAVAIVVACAFAGDHLSLGPSLEVTVIPPNSDDCTAPIYVNHNSTFENAYCWYHAGVVPPYYGAFGEAFDLGMGGIQCVAIWSTTSSIFIGQPLDLYVWDGGVTDEPGVVLYMLTGQSLTNIPFWPSVGQNNLEAGPAWCVDGAFTVGYWADFSSTECWYWIAGDEDGAGGHPWTNIAPGIGYPTGWQHPNVVWSSCRSLGFGVYFEEGGSSPPAADTWGDIKAMYR